MVYAEAAKKTGGYMTLAGILSLGVVSLSSVQETPTANVAADAGLSSSGMIMFAIGVFIGALVIGTYVYIAKVEAKRS
ncbi:MAG: hypothetical protein OXR66_03245 [Candidatus Woesearchaeota archaeon]|nr:hypothetical protein [Candidatus Woesearchaeota archaeon]